MEVNFDFIRAFFELYERRPEHIYLFIFDNRYCLNYHMCKHEILFEEFLTRFSLLYGFRINHLRCRKCNCEICLPKKYIIIAILLDILSIASFIIIPTILIPYLEIGMNIIAKFLLFAAVTLIPNYVLKLLFWCFLNKTGKWKEVKNDNDSNHD